MNSQNFDAFFKDKLNNADINSLVSVNPNWEMFKDNYLNNTSNVSNNSLNTNNPPVNTSSPFVNYGKVFLKVLKVKYATALTLSTLTVSSIGAGIYMYYNDVFKKNNPVEQFSNNISNKDISLTSFDSATISQNNVVFINNDGENQNNILTEKKEEQITKNIPKPSLKVNKKQTKTAYNINKVHYLNENTDIPATLNEKCTLIGDKKIKIQCTASEIQNFVANNMNYPDEALKNDIDGLVVISIYVNETGQIENTEVKKSAHEILDKEAIRVLNLLPKFSPAYKNNMKILVKIDVPILFKL